MIAHFLVGFGLSYIGSLPIGMINVTAANIALQKSTRLAIVFSLGAALVELVQGLVALQFTDYFFDNAWIEQTINYAALPIFVLIAFYYLFSKTDVKPSKNASNKSYFFKGIGVSSLNLLAIPYWIINGTYWESVGWVKMETWSLVSMSIGIGFGTLALLLCYIFAANRFKEKFKSFAKHSNKVVAVFFFGLAIFQLTRIL